MSETILLSGIVGSTAYGLAGPGSDVDRLGVYAIPTEHLHGLHPPSPKQQTRVTKNPDVTMHETGKLASLMLQGNPTVSELAWLPDALYEVRTPLGDELIEIRAAALAAPRVKAAYLGYATQQFERLSNKGKFPDVPVDRIAKHARHLYRLVEQGTHLFVTGELTIEVRSPQMILDFGETVAGGDVDAASSVLARAEATFTRCSSPLPDEPDEAPFEDWLRQVRATHWTEAR